MYKQLSPNVKSSITRSITQTFEQYMSEIEWNAERVDLEQFVGRWQTYITTKALWYDEVPLAFKTSQQFHEELAARINQVILKITEEPPTEDQIASIELLQEQFGTHYTYECKAHAAYIERLLQAHQSK